MPFARSRTSIPTRWQRRWRDGTRLPSGKLKEFKQSYSEPQKAQADLDDAAQRMDPTAKRIKADAVTVNMLLDRHLAAKRARAPGTLENDQHHAGHVRTQFGDRLVSTLTTTEIEVWSVRESIAAESRKKQVEILRAAIKRGIKDRLVESDPTDGIVVSLGHREMPHWSSEALRAVLAAAQTDLEKALLRVLGCMGLRSGEARSLLIADLIVAVADTPEEPRAPQVRPDQSATAA